MTKSKELARVITLLDEAKEDLADMNPGQFGNPVDISERKARVHSKITEAQNILIGADPTRRENN